MVKSKENPMIKSVTKIIEMPPSAQRLINILEQNGYHAHVVGGCVRDSLLGKTPKDWDICTNARPEQAKECFAGLRVIETGIKHGTITVLSGEPESKEAPDGKLSKKTPSKKTPHEITSYRIDGEYTDNRRPESVEFTDDLTEDMARRDFTVNAMAYNPREGLVDHFGGCIDLQNGIIRCVGEPQKRFNEDALRILRAVRFSSQLGFEIEGQTKSAMMEQKELLHNLSAERIREEFNGILCGADVLTACEKSREIIGEIIPEIRAAFDFDQRTKYHIYDVWMHTLHAVSNIRALPVLRLAAFFHDIGKPGMLTLDETGAGHFYKHEAASEELAKAILARLKYDKKTAETVRTLVKNHGIVFMPQSGQVKRMLNRLGEDMLRMLIELEAADVMSQSPRYAGERLANIEEFRRALDDIIEQEQCFSMKDLAVNGNTLMEMGVPQGTQIGEILNTLLDAVMEGKVENNREDLINHINGVILKK